MGEYSIYIWSCYGVVILMVAGMSFLYYRHKKSGQKQVKLLEDYIDQLTKEDQSNP